jgi:hypothetical protein
MTIGGHKYGYNLVAVKQCKKSLKIPETRADRGFWRFLLKIGVGF